MSVYWNRRYPFIFLLIEKYLGHILARSRRSIHSKGETDEKHFQISLCGILPIQNYETINN
jgi:hypothetical protein